MKIFVILPVLFIYSHSVFSQTNHPKIIITHLTGNFFIYTTFGNYKGEPIPSNSMYMVSSRGVVLFDTPWDSTQFQPLLDSIKLRHHQEVVMCIATHFHADRTAGLEYYKKRGIKTFTSKQTDDSSKVRHEKRAEFLIYRDSLFTVGQNTFQTYYAGAGHTADNIVIWFSREKILYGGCLVKSSEATDLGNLGDAHVNEWPSTIKKIQEKFKDPQYIIPGHMDWTSKESLNHTLDLIREYRNGK